MMTDLSIPHFWRKKSWQAVLLLPLSWLYLLMHRLKFRLTRTWVAPRPVICVGNLMMGGAGKTPLVLSIAEKLTRETGAAVAVLSRGYRGRSRQAVCVNPLVHSAQDVGDEALMMAHYVPCFVGRSKVELAKLAVSEGADVLLMDDGFQNASLYQNLRIVAVDGQVGFGNGWCFPAGPMREPMTALKRASLVVMLGDADSQKLFVSLKKRNIDILRARAVPAQKTQPDKQWFAFAGIGFPEKFFHHLQLTGFAVKKTRSYPNHYMLSNRDMMDLFKTAKADNLNLVTTEKDWVRIPRAFRKKIHCHRIDMVWEQDDEINKRLKNFIYFTDCMV